MGRIYHIGGATVSSLFLTLGQLSAAIYGHEAPKEFCENCERETQHEYQEFDAGTRDQPGQPGGEICLECDGFTPDMTQDEYLADRAGY